MKENARELVQDAIDARNNNDLQHAGNLYSAAAHEYMGEVTEHVFLDGTHAAVSQCCFAAVCYRLAGDEARVQNRCDMGILLAEDYLEYIDHREIEPQSFADLRRGAWPEFIGDLRTIARRDDAEEAYDRAREIYESAGDWEIAMAEQEHIRLTGFFRDVKEGLGHDSTDESDIELRPLGPTFTDWLEYKRERLPCLLDELEERGEWPT